MISFSAQTQTAIEFAADLIRQSRHVTALTGAGLSTPSGIPDFRSEGKGLWSQDEPMEVASLHTFRTAPEKFFQWFRPLAGQVYGAKPNAAHLALAELEKAGKLATIITQNIDMLHQKAGSSAVIETHGSISSLSCTQCYHRVKAEQCVAHFIETGDTPHCPQCGGVLKPDVILFASIGVAGSATGGTCVRPDDGDRLITGSFARCRPAHAGIGPRSSFGDR
jgi:NAD-dependent deacetylase